jgi:hypothetical protein
MEAYCQPCDSFSELEYADSNADRTVSTCFNYLAPLALYDSEKPYLSRLPSLPDLVRTNIVANGYDVKVQEITGREQSFGLDDCGFEYAKFPCQITHWSDEVAQQRYLPKLEAWLERHLNARVYIYAYNVSAAVLARKGSG